MDLVTVQTIRIIICGLLHGMNVTSTTAVNCSVATSLSESLPNDGEEQNQLKRLLFLKCDYGKISMKCVFSLAFSRSGIYS